jgi:GT2 family glycosyltransferase
MKKEPLIYIVILNYNNTKLTIDCLTSLYKLTYTNYKIIVVDDCSKDYTINGVLDIFPEVALIRNEKNINYCKSFNVGIREALKNNAQYIFMVNNDTKNFSHNYLEEIMATFNNNEKLGMVGSRCFDYQGGERRGQVASIRFGIEMNVPTEGYVIKREVFEKVGLLNEWLIIYFEDLDYIARIKEKGFDTDINLSISFDHLGGGTTSKVVFTSNYYRVRNLIMFTKKYCSNRSLVVNLKEIIGNLGAHYSKLIYSLKGGEYIKAVKIVVAVLLGIMVGLITPVSVGWKEKYMSSL